MAEPSDMIMPMLREMRAENEVLHKQTQTILDLRDQGLNPVETTQKSFRHALTADTLMSRLLTGEFEQRITLLEKQVRDFQDAS